MSQEVNKSEVNK